MTLEICCPSTGGHEAAVLSWVEHASQEHPLMVLDAIEGEQAGYLQKVDFATRSSHADILAFFHSDLIIHEDDWDLRVLKCFEDPDVAVAGFGGALRHGHPDLYRTPYDYRQLARDGWLSNLSDAEVHGTRETGVREVAVVDSFSIIIRRSFLTRVGGWPVGEYPPSHVSDYWACCMAHKLGLKVMAIGVSCTHASGGVRGDGRFDYPKWIAGTKWGSDANCHAIGHKLIYEQFRDVLPWEVK